jgi:integrase
VPRAPRGRGSVFEDKSRGRWVAQIKVHGKATRRYAKTPEEAWELRDELAANVRIGVSTQTTTLARYLDEWLAGVEVAPSTLLGYRSKVRLYLIPELGTVALNRLAPAHLRRLFKALKDRDLSPATIRQTRAILQAALRQAIEDGLVSRNVASLVRPPASQKAETTALTPDQARAFLESLRGERLEALYATAVLLGLRQGELLGLRWQDVAGLSTGSGPVSSEEASPRSVLGHARGFPATSGTILHIEQTLGRFEGRYIKGKPKTSNSRRTLPVPQVLVSLLSDWKISQKAEFLKYGVRPEHDLVFTTQGGNPINGSWLTHDLYRRLESAGLPRVRFHDLRHSAASLLLAEGFGMREVMLVLGHSTIAQSMDVYAHIPEETIRLKMKRLDEWRAR